MRITDRNFYLVTVTDAYFRKIRGEDVSDVLAVEKALRVDIVIKQGKYSNWLIHHSDRGLQYCVVIVY